MHIITKIESCDDRWALTFSPTQYLNPKLTLNGYIFDFTITMSYIGRPQQLTQQPVFPPTVTATYANNPPFSGKVLHAIYVRPSFDK